MRKNGVHYLFSFWHLYSHFHFILLKYQMSFMLLCKGLLYTFLISGLDIINSQLYSFNLNDFESRYIYTLIVDLVFLR